MTDLGPPTCCNRKYSRPHMLPCKSRQNFKHTQAAIFAACDNEQPALARDQVIAQQCCSGVNKVHSIC